MRDTEFDRKRRRVLKKRNRAKLKERAIALLGGECAGCGYRKSVAALCFHHIDPKEKDFALSQTTKSNWEEIKAEVLKCQLLCLNCHAEIHEAEYKKRYSALEAELGIAVRDGTWKCFRCGLRFHPTKHEQRMCVACFDGHKRNKRLNETEIRGLLATGRTIVEIADETTYKVFSLIRFCRKHGIAYARGGLVEERDSKAEWPVDSVLRQMVWSDSLVTVGKKIGVTDNAVRKRCRKQGITLPTRADWSFRRAGKKKVGNHEATQTKASDGHSTAPLAPDGRVLNF